VSTKREAVDAWGGGADPICVSQYSEVDAVVHPFLGDDLLAVVPRGHAARVVLHPPETAGQNQK
jgi:hypothetical protein